MARLAVLLILTSLIWCLVPAVVAAQEITLLNVSYDPTRELYEELNQTFIDHWRDETHQKLTIRQSHGGSTRSITGRSTRRRSTTRRAGFCA